ncbi:MAG TPA: hypothetical protein VHQ22_18395 [Terriglobales bacterium]|nr:hypothetical protein [Terriglobales bacterium]
MTASPEELSRYLGHEAGLEVPVHIASEDIDLSAELKRALSHARGGNNPQMKGAVMWWKRHSLCDMNLIVDTSGLPVRTKPLARRTLPRG